MSAVQPAIADEDELAAPAAELFVVLNLASGKHDKADVREVLEAELRQAGRPYRIIPVPPGKVVQTCLDAAQLAREHAGALVAVGGDGTINCAAQAALTHDCPLGLVPQGTFNLFARDLGIPLDPAEALRGLLSGQAEPVQVGLVNQRVFLVNASVGLYPKLLADREQVKQKLGRRRWIAMLSALVTLFEWSLQLSLEADLDGDVKRLRTPTLFVCNNRLQLRRIGIDESVVAQVGQGRLGGVLVKTLSTWDKVQLIWRAIFGTMGDAHEVDTFTLRSINLTARNARRLRVATDGEVQWMQLPLRFTVAPRPLRVLLPPAELRVPPQ